MTADLSILALGLFAGCIGGVLGTGSSIVLLPALVPTFGPKQAVPIMAVACVMGNFARVFAWRREDAVMLASGPTLIWTAIK